MKVLIEPDPAAAGRLAAETVARAVRARPACVVGLPVGGTPEGMYRGLVELHRDGHVEFRTVTTFNPDELVGVEPRHPASYHAYMRRNFFDHVDLMPSRRHLPDGTADDPVEEARRYARALKLAGGVDLFVLGVGGDGHLAMNEPGSSLASRCRVVPVTLARRGYLAEQFGDERDVPRHAITLGIADILDAGRVLLLAFGAGKAEIVRQIVEGPLTANVPASALQMHPDCTILVDEAAAARLESAAYWKEARSLGEP